MAQPSRTDVLAAIEHADVYGDKGWTPADFTLAFLGDLDVKSLGAYDDLSSWLEFAPRANRREPLSARLRELRGFRGPEWAARASGWLKTGIPPIVVITAPDEDGVSQTQIGDGRGRVNFAALMGMRVPVWHLKFREASAHRTSGHRRRR